MINVPLLPVIAQGMTMALAGMTIGLLAALVMSKLISSLLYRVGERDAWTFSLAPLLFLAVALLASYLPARRATEVNPVDALKGN